MTTEILTVFSGVSFLAYGWSCLTSPAMEREFLRFGLAHRQRLVGTLELLGAAGLLVGLIEPLVGFTASAGLTMLMLLGFLVRLRIKDGLVKSSPALLFMLFNLFLCLRYLRILAHE